MQNDLMYLHLFLCISAKLGCVPLHLYIHSMRNSAPSHADCQTVQCLRSAQAQSCVTAADWVSWSRDLCFRFDRRVWNFWVKSSLRLYLWRLLSWWLMTGTAFQWVKEFCWTSFFHCTKHNIWTSKQYCCLHDFVFFCILFFCEVKFLFFNFCFVMKS